MEKNPKEHDWKKKKLENRKSTINGFAGEDASSMIYEEKYRTSFFFWKSLLKLEVKF